MNSIWIWIWIWKVTWLTLLIVVGLCMIGGWAMTNCKRHKYGHDYTKWIPLPFYSVSLSSLPSYISPIKILQPQVHAIEHCVITPFLNFAPLCSQHKHLHSCYSRVKQGSALRCEGRCYRGGMDFIFFLSQNILPLATSVVSANRKARNQIRYYLGASSVPGVIELVSWKLAVKSNYFRSRQGYHRGPEGIFYPMIKVDP